MKGRYQVRAYAPSYDAKAWTGQLVDTQTERVVLLLAVYKLFSEVVAAGEYWYQHMGLTGGFVK